MPRCSRMGLLLWAGVASWAWGDAGFSSTGRVATANCVNCHGWRQPVEEKRPLVTPHDTLATEHGPKAGLWCLDCHHAREPGQLKASQGQKVPFQRAEEHCQTCHARQTRDWRAGVHGKRLDSWQGERVVLRCDVCHNPHAPRFTAMVPSPPPALAKGVVEP